MRVGTHLMTNKDNRIVRPVLRRLVKQILELYERDIIPTITNASLVLSLSKVHIYSFQVQVFTLQLLMLLKLVFCLLKCFVVSD